MSNNESSVKLDYENRFNKVFLYIEKNLNSDLSLQTVSEVACFSPFHFHRLFKSIVGETLNEYITRRRIEKSASDLIHKSVGVSEISLKHGFNDNSSFTRTFKKYYGVSPTEFRQQNPHKFSKIRQLESKNGQEYPGFEKYICIINDHKNWTKMNAKIEIKELPKMEVAYVSNMGCQNLEMAYQKLMRWATPKGLLNDQTKMITVYHDSFKVTEANKVRMSACMILDEKVDKDEEVEFTSIERGKFIVGSYFIGLDEFEKSWTGLFIWMNENGYKKADRDPLEIYHNNFNEHPDRKCIVDFCIPIQ